MTSAKSVILTTLFLLAHLIFAELEVTQPSGLAAKSPVGAERPCEGPCAECQCTGRRGPRGNPGPRGPTGAKGLTGPAGINGSSGNFIGTNLFYGTVDVNDVNTSPFGSNADYSLNFTSAVTVGPAFTWTTTTVTCQLAGVYAFYYSVNPVYAGKVYIMINGSQATLNSVFGQDYKTSPPPSTTELSNSPYSGQLIRELFAGDEIQLRYESLTDMLLDGDLQTPTLLIYKIAELSVL